MKRSPKNLQITFSGKRLPHFGGLYLLQKFFQKINLQSLLSQYTSFFQRNNRYTVTEEMLALIYPISLGLGRIETSHLSQEVGQALLSSPSLFQRAHQRFLAWKTSPWGYPYCYRNHRTLGSMLSICFLFSR